MATAPDTSRDPSPWTARITGSRATAVLDIVENVGRRLFDDLGSCSTRAGRYGTRAWRSTALASGFPGLTLCGLVLEQVFPGRLYAQRAGRSITYAARATQDAPVGRLGMFAGVVGLAFSTEMLAQSDERYRGAADDLRARVVGMVLSRSWSVSPEGLSFDDYDVVSGAAGVLRYLLMVAVAGDPEVAEAIEVLLDYLVLIATVTGPGGVPGWFVSSERLYKEAVLAKECPYGFLDLGLAHGISGVLAAMSLAWQAQHRVAGQEAATGRLARWLLAHRRDDAWGVSWPQVIPIDANGSPVPVDRLAPFPAAWCYGSAGIARALWHAGRALEDPVLTDTAVESVRAMVRRPVSSRWGDGPANVCHGEAGRLVILLRFAHETAMPGIDAHIEAAIDRLIAYYSPEHEFGFIDRVAPGEFSDDPGLLNGAAGVCMSLAAAVTSAAPDWDRAVLNS